MDQPLIGVLIGAITGIVIVVTHLLMSRASVEKIVTAAVDNALQSAMNPVLLERERLLANSLSPELFILLKDAGMLATAVTAPQIPASTAGTLAIPAGDQTKTVTVTTSTQTPHPVDLTVPEAAKTG